LTEALAEVARRSPSQIDLDLRSVGRYEQPVETAMYFTALEALSNASKHAPEAAVSIQLAELERDGRPHLVLEVSDNGPGYSPTEPATTRGMLNMNDRIRAVDGEFAVRTAPGEGVLVTASIPVDTP